MKIKIQSFKIQPERSIILNNLQGDIHYTDSFKVMFVNKCDFSIDYLTALLFASDPKWVKFLLNLRDLMVKPFGLKSGLIPESASLDKSIRYAPGDRLVLFPVIDRSESEIVMAEDDKHLYFRSSLLIQDTSDRYLQAAYLTTIVQFHNIWGKIYFAIVRPFHRLIMKEMLANFVEALT
jgi:hypothetical protein